MKAVVQDRYGSADDLELRDIEAPNVGLGDVLVRVCAASLHPDIWHVVAGWPYVLRLMGAGLRRPTNPVPGTDVAGIVESVGGDVTRFVPGDAVLGEVVRGFQWTNGGAFAELVSAPEDAFVTKPGHLTFEQAAAAPTSGLLAVQIVRDEAGVKAGHQVLINGAGGSVGTFAVQIAKGLGATVTAVDVTHKLDTLRSIGAEHVVDCTRDDVTRGDTRFDVIVDIASTLRLRDALRVLTPDGRYVLVGHDHYGSGAGAWLGSIPRMVRLMLGSAFDRRLPRPRWPEPFVERLEALRQLLENGTVTPVVDRVFALGEVREAMRYLQSGQATGKVVLRVSEAAAEGEPGARDSD